MTTQDYVAMMRQAKARLAGHWTDAVVATLIYVAILGAASFTYVGSLIIVGPMTLGYVIYLMSLADTSGSDYNLLFVGFHRFAETLVAGLLVTLAASIGFALLIVPGIIVSLGFSMTFFIMADDKDISGIDAMKQSWEMMQGHKWELFCLMIRFIGWYLLCLLTFGIGSLWLQPYVTVTQLNFYRQLRHGTF